MKVIENCLPERKMAAKFLLKNWFLETKKNTKDEGWKVWNYLEI